MPSLSTKGGSLFPISLKPIRAFALLLTAIAHLTPQFTAQIRIGLIPNFQNQTAGMLRMREA